MHTIMNYGEILHHLITNMRVYTENDEDTHTLADNL